MARELEIHRRRRRLGLAGSGRLQYYQKYRNAQADHAATVYADFQKALASNDDTQAGKLLDSLAGEHANSAYTQEGRLLLAKRHADAGRFDEAIKQLRAGRRHSSDEELAAHRAAAPGAPADPDRQA